MATDTATISRERVEKALWDFTEYQGDASLIAGLMVIFDTYAASQAAALVDAPAPVLDAHLHTLVHLAEQLIDTGGKLALPDPAEPPVLALPAVTLPAAKRPVRARKLVPRQSKSIWPICRTCRVKKKPEDYFRDSKNKVTGRKSQCKKCEREQVETKKSQAA